MSDPESHQKLCDRFEEYFKRIEGNEQLRRTKDVVLEAMKQQ